MEEKVKLEALIALLEEAKVDYSKLYEKNTKSAASKLRKKLQEVAKLAKIARTEATEYKKSL